MSSLKALVAGILLNIAALLLLQLTAQAQAEQKPKGTGAIAGQVTVSGKPAAGIAIAAFSIEAGFPRAPLAKTLTDDEGRYRLEALAPASYIVAPLTPNFPTLESRDPSYSFLFGGGKNVIVAAGEQVEGIDIKLARGAVITGRITDADNRPVIEERVSIQAIGEAGQSSARVPGFTYLAQMNVTDDRGIYRIYGLPAGRYQVSVGSAPGDGQVSLPRGYFQRTYYPDTTDATRAEIVNLTEGGEATNIDIHVGRRIETYKATGYVVDETGALVRNARIGFKVVPKDGNRFYPWIAQQARDGNFKLEGLAPGRYAASVTSDADSADYYGDPVQFEIVDQDVNGIELRAKLGLAVSGTIATESGELKDLLRALPGLRVSVDVRPIGSNDDQQRSFGSVPIMPDGTFQVRGLRPGRARISLYSNSPLIRPQVVSVEHAGLGIAEAFEIQPGRSVSDLRVVVAYGTGVIRGSVKFVGGTPSQNMRVGINCVREGTPVPAGGGQVDERGHFLLRGLAPGRYEVSLQVVPVTRGQRPPPPQKQLVTVTNEVESEANFVLDLSSTTGGP